MKAASKFLEASKEEIIVEILYNKGLRCLNTGVGKRVNSTDLTLVSQTLAEGDKCKPVS